MSQFGLPEYDTGIITSDVNLVKLFEHTVETAIRLGCGKMDNGRAYENAQ